MLSSQTAQRCLFGIVANNAPQESHTDGTATTLALKKEMKLQLGKIDHGNKMMYQINLCN
jgi:hypothetical protein